MPLYVLNRNYALMSLSGRGVNFQKGVPVWVTPEAEKEALAIGAQPADGPKDILDPEVPVKPELSAEERTAAIYAAFKELETRQLREDFTAQGVPNTKAVEKLTTFDITSKERDDAWSEYKKLAAE